MKSQDVICALEHALSGDRDRLIASVRCIHASESAANRHDIAKRISRILDRYGSALGKLVALRERGWQGFTVIEPAKKIGDLLLPDDLRHSLEVLRIEHERRDLLAENNLRPRSKLLFHGPPGNGKTAAAEAVAEFLAVPFLLVNHHDLIDSHMGDTSRNLAKAFASAGNQPCVMFIDELDAVGESRGGSSGAEKESSRIVNSLLMALDAMPNCCTFIGATNRLDAIDHAMVRRFDTTLEFPAPTEQQIAAFVATVKRRHPVLAGVNVEPAEVAGLSFAEIETGLVNLARELIVSADVAAEPNSRPPSPSSPPP